MEKELQVLVVDSEDDSAITLKMLASEGNVFHSHVAFSLVEALNILAQRSFDIILSELNLADSQGLATFEALRLHTHDIPIVVTTSADNEHLAFSAVEHGAQDYLIKGRVAAEAVTRVIRYAVARHKGTRVNAGGAQETGRTIGVLGAKGGVGTTTIAAHMAVELRTQTMAERAPEPAEHRVLLIDLAASSASTSFFFQTKSDLTLADAASNLHRLDREFWKGVVAETKYGVDLLSPAGSRGYTEMPAAERVRHVVRFARHLYPLIVIDLGAPGVMAMEVIQEVQNLILVVTPQLMEMLEARRVLTKLAEAAFPAESIDLVWNRTTRQHSGAILTFEKALGRTAVRAIAECSADIEARFGEGRFMDTGLPLHKEAAQLVAHLLGHDTTGTPRSLMALLAHVSPRRKKAQPPPVPG